MEIRPILSSLLRSKTGAILVALQVALSLAILANALFIVQERRTMAARPTGLADEHATFSIGVRSLDLPSPERQLATLRRQLDVLRAVPGVVAVSQVSQMPASGRGNMANVYPQPRGKDRGEGAVASMYFSGDSLVRGFGLRLVEGRDFLPAELVDMDITTTSDLPHQLIVTKALAAKLWPGTSALGKMLYFGGDDATDTRTVVGVVERLQSAQAEVGANAEYSMLLPWRTYGGPWGQQFAVRCAPGQLDRVMKEAEGALRHASATPIVLKLRTVDEDRHDRYRADIALQWMLVAVSVLLLLVTGSGIVGMASLWVTQRRKQIGVRRALGARRVDILRYFIVENLLITSAGVSGGVLLGLGLNALLVSRLEMARLPAGHLVGGALLLWLLGVCAAWGPAWRAASIAPAAATRSV